MKRHNCCQTKTYLFGNSKIAVLAMAKFRNKIKKLPIKTWERISNIRHKRLHFKSHSWKGRRVIFISGLLLPMPREGRSRYGLSPVGKWQREINEPAMYTAKFKHKSVSYENPINPMTIYLTNRSQVPCVCSVIDHRWRQNVVRSKRWHTRHSLVCHWCSYHTLTSSVICYWTDAPQLGIYLFYIIKN